MFILRLELKRHIHLTSVHKPALQLLDNEDIIPGMACKICLHILSSKKEWLHHHETLHRNDYFSFCGECCKAFKSANGSSQHRLKYHSTANDTFFTCRICSSKHTTSYKLRIHERSHSADKPFVCLICKRSYKHKKDLNGHFCNTEVL